MDFDDIEKILALVREHELAEFELERDGLKLRVEEGAARCQHADAVMRHAGRAVPAAGAASAADAPPRRPCRPPPDEELELAVVKSPIVGTFYRSPGARRRRRSSKSGSG